MTKPLNTKIRISRTAQACLSAAANGNNDMARVLLHRIQRRRTEAARRESEMLRGMLDYAQLNADFTAFVKKEEGWLKELQEHLEAKEAKDTEDLKGIATEIVKKRDTQWKAEMDKAVVMYVALETEMESWKKRAQIAEAQAALPWWRRLFDAAKKGPVAATTGQAQNDHTAETARG